MRLVVTNEGAVAFTGDIALPFAPEAVLDEVLAGPKVTVVDAAVRVLSLPPGGFLVTMLREP